MLKKYYSLCVARLFISGLFLLLISSCQKERISSAGQPKDELRSATITANASSHKLTATKTGPLNVCYIEVNNYSIADVGKYSLSGGANVFDIGIIFAANINYDTVAKSAVLYFNPQVTSSLANTTAIKALQAKGIKVLLSILGNHEGAGISNFPSQAAAQAFAKLLSNAVTTYGLDGIDFDDEYADYGTNGTGQPNASSFVYLTTALRTLMPSKIISFYFIGPASTSLSYKKVTVGSKINYSWNPYYGTYAAPVVPGLTKTDLAPAAIDISSTTAASAAALAKKTVKNTYGVFLCYNLSDSDSHVYLTSVTDALYGQATVYNP
jgi:hypothetical protein